MSRLRLALAVLLAASAVPVLPAHASGPIVPPRADLELTGKAPAEVANGEPFTHTFTVRNLGPDTAVDVVVEGLDQTEFGGSCQLSKCALGDLAPGAAATVTATWAEPAVFPPFPGTFKSSARVTSATADPNSANDAASLSTYRRPYEGPPIGPAPSPPGPPAPGAPTPADPPVPCANVTSGSPATDDDLQASAAGDTLVGFSGADVLRGGPAKDCLRGGAGADRLLGAGGDDTLDGGRGRDRISGGPGGDLVLAFDGTRDVIDCGAGRDRVVADRRDVVRRCERVTRRPAGTRAAA